MALPYHKGLGKTAHSVTSISTLDVLLAYTVYTSHSVRTMRIHDGVHAVGSLSCCWACPWSWRRLPRHLVRDNLILSRRKHSVASPDISCWRSPVIAPTIASFLPPRRSIVPSAYCFACAAWYSASPCACSSFPDCFQDCAPVRSPIVSTTAPFNEWYWPVVLLHRSASV